MYLRVLRMDDFVEINNLKEITNPVYLSGGKPTSDGLFSNEIFGITPQDRSSIWAYIDLGDYFLHPLAAINLRRYSKHFEALINGVKRYSISDEGQLVPDEENGGTGLKFLYDNWDKLKFRISKSIFPAERSKFLSQPKENIWLTKFTVTPPFYRDINEGSEMGVHKINDEYKKLISQSSMLRRRSGSFNMFGDMSRANIQNTLVDIFNYYVFEEFHGKFGVMRRNVMGVDVIRGARLVMSAPKIKGKTYKDMQVNFDHTGIPLATACAIGYEFVLKGLRDFFDNEFIRGGKYPYKDKDGKLIMLTLIQPEIDFSDDYLKKKLDAFVHGVSTRFETIPIPKNKEGIEGKIRITGMFDRATANVSSRAATWTDILYLIANRVLSTKHVTVTRYPIEDFYCIFHTKMAILSTTQTTYAKIGNEEYNFYPVVEPDTDSSNSFADTLVPSNVYLKGIGGDYDGDQVTVRLAYSDEANADVEKFRRSKKNFVNLMGGNIRLTERDFVQCLYSLTKDPKEIPMGDLN